MHIRLRGLVVAGGLALGVALVVGLSLYTALPATAARSAGEASMTVRLISTPGRTAVKDVPPKTMGSGELTKGDTISGTSILRNAAPQFGKAKGAAVGGDKYVMTATSPGTLLIKAQVKLPGGTLRVEGRSALKRIMRVPVVGGTGAFAGARGTCDSEHEPGVWHAVLWTLKR